MHSLLVRELDRTECGAKVRDSENVSALRGMHDPGLPPASGERAEPLQREGKEGAFWAGKYRMGWVYGQRGMQAVLSCQPFPGCVSWSMKWGQVSLGLDGSPHSHQRSIQTPCVLLKESEQAF